MKKAWITLHLKDKNILNTVCCALYTEDEEANHFEWKTLTVEEAMYHLLILKKEVIELEKKLYDKQEMYNKTHAKLVRLQETFINNFM